MNKMLLIIDCQYDFINGSMGIKGSEEMVQRLAEYVKEHGKDYKILGFSADWHPYNHCSFTKEGGLWPVHCIPYTRGGALYESLTDAAYSTGVPVHVFEKGNDSRWEEYSLFGNKLSTERVKQLVKENNIEQIEICGIAAEYCVKESIEGAIKEFGSDMVTVFRKYIVAFEDIRVLDDVISKNNLKVID